METIVLPWEDAHEDADFSNWLHENEIEDVLSLFEGDPDLMYIESSSISFTDIQISENKQVIIYVDSNWEVSEEKIKERLLLFFQKDFADYFERPDINTWETFHGNSDAIAYRGGAGYNYTIWIYNPISEEENTQLKSA